MKKIVFTRREIERAWRCNRESYKSAEEKSNAHRLMLFYAIECGLKAVIMRQQSKEVTDDSVTNFSHDINKILDFLHVNSRHLELESNLFSHSSSTITLVDYQEKGRSQARQCHVSQINEMWRYGHCFPRNNQLQDEDIEKDLLRIAKWIEKELRG